jgi:hypothetical protein
MNQDNEIVIGSAVRLQKLKSLGARHSLELNTTYVVIGVHSGHCYTRYKLNRNGKFAGVCCKNDDLVLV